jgi:excisionase family DNA binding protein
MNQVERPRSEARKRRILACAAALCSQPEGVRCEHVTELIRMGRGINIEREIFEAAYGDPRGRKYWEAHLSKGLTDEALADLLSAHLQDTEESQNAIIDALDSCRRSSVFLLDADPEARVRWLLTKPKRAHLVPSSLRLFLSSKNSTSLADTTTPELVSRDVQDARPLAVSVKMACKLVGVGNTTMWALIKNGRVKTVRIGRRRLIIYTSLERLLILEDTAS